MDNYDTEALLRHIRGATVVHRSPFSSLEVPVTKDGLSAEQCDKWVAPFYRVSFRGVDEGFLRALRQVYREITPELVELLLREFDWRPRLTAAFFAILKRFDHFEEHIGKLLLRSDVCYAGKSYCAALAEFNTPKGLGYLRTYLEYYLTRLDLVYDQIDAMAAVAYLDGLNGTRHLSGLMPLWSNYVTARKWNLDLEKVVGAFSAEMDALHARRTQAEAR